jgi:hypothetical protein
MAKADAKKVNDNFARVAIERAKSLGSVYSECVKFSYQSTGRLSCGFDAKDIIEWIKINMPNAFDEKGNKK